MTTIVVEDGTVVANANSYQSVADLRSFATERGLALPVSDDDCGVLLLNAIAYMDRVCGLIWVGSKFSRDQPLSWPRHEVWVDNWHYHHDELPKQLSMLQLTVACELFALAGQDVMPTAFPNDHGSVASEEVSGAVRVSYENNARVLKVAAIEKAQIYILALTTPRYIRAIRA
jgi:hypothetical protein